MTGNSLPYVTWRILKLDSYNLEKRSEVVDTRKGLPFAISSKVENGSVISTLAVRDIGLCLNKVILSCWASNNVEDMKEMKKFEVKQGKERNSLSRRRFAAISLDWL